MSSHPLRLLFSPLTSSFLHPLDTEAERRQSAAPPSLSHVIAYTTMFTPNRVLSRRRKRLFFQS